MSRCTCRVTPASWQCAWTWTSRSSPRTCRRPGGGPGIYDTLIPILQQWNQQYDFVGSYYINIGDNPNGADPSTTDWSEEPALLPSHPGDGQRDRHPLLHPPHQSTDRDVHRGHRRRYAGRFDPDHLDRSAAIVLRRHGGHVGHGLRASARTRRCPAPPARAARSPTRRSRRCQATRSPSAMSPADLRRPVNDGALGDIPAGTTLTFSIPAENTNFLQTATTANPVLSAAGNPFTYDYEFNSRRRWRQRNSAPRSRVPPFQAPTRRSRPTRTSCPITNRSPRPRQRPDIPVI